MNSLFAEYPTVEPKPRPAIPAWATRRDPFRLEGPAQVAFSGGRTSGYMLRRILDAGQGPDLHVLFANTGREREATLEFVRDVGERWGVPIHWLEYRGGTAKREVQFSEVTFATAARHGEPFDLAIAQKDAIPNRRMRWCTSLLKVFPMQAWMRAQGYAHWTSAIGVRADEPSRVAKVLGRPVDPEEDPILPLYAAGIGEAEVLEFWRRQPFDLQLAPGDSNCDLCFLKGAGIRLALLRRDPECARWWLEQERKTGATWINPDSRRPSYAQLYQLAVLQTPVEFPADELDTHIDCVCGD